jgi:bifunctional UDP-N-acetylglucosamine pyrophosphorylase/glucosamine-1-phosphate N-acetyltransferase
MKAVILAAGEGVRMHPLTYTRPKVMLPIANKPILEHLVIEAKKAGINEFALVIGYQGETVRNHFGDGEKWGVSIEYVSQRKQLGTAHALKMAEICVHHQFLLSHGDILLSEKDIANLVAKDSVALGVIEVENPENPGLVENIPDGSLVV